MSDSEKTNELDSYGVWVKKPPRTVEPESGSDADSALPDFDGLADSDEINGEPFDFGGSGESESGESLGSGSGDGGMEDVSLDEFGFSDSDDGAAPGGEPAAAAGEGGSEVTVSDAPAPADDDGPIDIDLSFDDGEAAGAAQEKPDDGTESVDLAEFGFDDTDEEDKSEPKVNEDGTENVDLSEFGFDDDAGGQKEEAEPPKEEPRADDGTEDVDLSEFGFDDDGEPEQKAPAPAAEGDGVRMTVVADDDLEDEPQADGAAASDNGQEPDGDEFDVDNILNSVEDENGNKVSLDGAKTEADAEPEPEKTDSEIADEIPDTFDEETASLMDDGEAAENGGAQAHGQENMTAETNSILSQIVSQLSSLKDEITSLKQDVENIKSRPAKAEPEPAVPEEPAAEDEIIPTDSNGGFFDDDDDDTIALSGDELDNILNTAEITTEDADGDDTADEAAESAIDEPTASDDTADEAPLDEGEPEVSDATAEDSVGGEEPAASDEMGDALGGGEPTISDETSEDEIVPAAPNGGFFDDDDDDTIALSGDELDNILNTAEITTEDADEAADGGDEPTASDDTADEATDEAAIDEGEPTISDEGTIGGDEMDAALGEGEPAEDEIIPAASSGGFFDDDDDDTLALSGDELDNILNTSEITAEDAEDQPDEETARALDTVEDTTLESVLNGQPDDDALPGGEPALDDTGDEDEEDVPEDMDIPKVDDVLVEEASSDGLSDMMEPQGGEPAAEGEDGELDDFSFDEPAPEAAEAEDVSALDEAEEVAVSPEESADEFLTPDPSIGESLTESNLDYLNSDPTIGTDSTGEQEVGDGADKAAAIPSDLRTEIKSVLSYMDKLLENLPEDKIAEFAQSTQFETYKKLFKELGLS